MQSFGISRQQASKGININEHASKNLTYDKQIKGKLPSTSRSYSKWVEPHGQHLLTA